jgi:hypothetical protein
MDHFFSKKMQVFSQPFEEFSPAGDIVVHRFILVVHGALNEKIFFAAPMYTGKIERISAACLVLTSVLRDQKPTLLP